jgi:hypothetical protein
LEVEDLPEEQDIAILTLAFFFKSVSRMAKLSASNFLCRVQAFFDPRPLYRWTIRLIMLFTIHHAASIFSLLKISLYF